jgi:Protein of unknown function (DUF4238)
MARRRAGERKKPTTHPCAEGAVAKPLESSEGAVLKDEYQHYIPRFVLREFALETHLHHLRERHLIYKYSIPTGVLQIADVDHSYGMYNMYTDIQNHPDFNRVERELSQLEQGASKVIKQCLHPSKTEITLTYLELRDLRKFLWIMSFRHPQRQQQYVDSRFGERSKVFQNQFMEAKGRTTYGEAWLENIKGILFEDIPDVKRVLYGDDIDWQKGFGPCDDCIGDPNTTTMDLGFQEKLDYITQNRLNFLGIWEAEEPYEFILTENGHGIYDGNCGRSVPGRGFHFFHPLSPRRMLVLSKNMFKLSNDPLAEMNRAIEKELFGLSPEHSGLPQEIHVSPVVEYFEGPSTS